MTITVGGSNITFPDATTQTTAGLPLTGGTLSGAVVVPTLNTPSGVLATQNGMTGIAKAWVQYDGSTSTLAGSFNVGSVTKNSTGSYRINFTTAMPNTTYAAVTAANPAFTATALSIVTGSLLTTSVSVAIYGGASGVAQDAGISVIIISS